MRTRSLCLAALTAFCLVGVGLAFGQQQQNDAKKAAPGQQQPSQAGQSDLDDFLQEYDRNKDGTIAKEELPARLRSDFDRLDRNKDGKLDRQELRQHARRMRDRQGQQETVFIWILRAPRDQVTQEDLQKAYSLLRKLDQNNDGQLAKEELQAAREQVVRHCVENRFKDLDTNQDGQLSSEELGPRMRQQVSRFDTNNDGNISKEEMMQAVAAHASEGDATGAEEEAEKTGTKGTEKKDQPKRDNP